LIFEYLLKGRTLVLNKRTFGGVIAVVLIAAFASILGVHAAMAATTLTCSHVHGTLRTQVVAAGETRGTITQGGLLNGTTQDQITSSNSSTGTYTALFQDTTEKGTLATKDNGQFSPNGLFVENGAVDGSASTGGFVGATGSLTFSGSTTDGIHFTAKVTGVICMISL
jgi:hypothetical protein